MTTGAEVWDTWLPKHGSQVRMALAVLSKIPQDELDEAINKAIASIRHETTMGPLLDPTAYQDGSLFENARTYVQIMQKLSDLRRALP